MGQRLSIRGFSLIEVMVGAAILLVSALAVAYLMQGSVIPKVDSLKACQDINEEVLAQINALGNGDFSYVYGTDSVTNLLRYCPPSVCKEGGIGLNAGTRWSSQRPLTTTANPPVVNPQTLRISSINYLLALYKSGEYCTRPGTLPSGDLDIFNRLVKNNILQSRQRDGDTRIQIQALRPGGAPFCPNRNSLEIRPSAAETGHTSPVLDQGVVSAPGAADSTLGFRVSVVTTYNDPNNPTQQTCMTQKEFFYQSETYRGQVTTNFVGTPPFVPSLPPGPITLPLCSDPTEVAFTKRFLKSKRDSVLLCRNRSQIGAWASPAKCDPLDPSSPDCGCDLADGCLNTWATFTPAVEPPASLGVPAPATNPWFPCDQLPNVLMLANLVDSPNQVQVRFVNTGNGGIDIQVTDLKNEVPRRLPKKIRIDVIEVDSALNSSADKAAAVPGDELATLKVDFFGHQPGLVCEDCDNPSGFEFVCAAACPTCCDPNTQCCPGDSWPANPNCACTDPDPCVCDPSSCVDKCDDWAALGYSSRVCCDTNNADSSCSSCDTCTDPSCSGYDPNRCSCAAYAAANPATCGSAPPPPPPSGCTPGFYERRNFCSGLSYMDQEQECKLQDPSTNVWAIETFTREVEDCSTNSCPPGQSPDCQVLGGCGCKPN